MDNLFYRNQEKFVRYKQKLQEKTTTITAKNCFKLDIEIIKRKKNK